MSSSVQVSNSNSLVFDHNQTLNQQDSNNNWILLAESNWNATKADLFDLFDGLCIDLCVEVERSYFVNWGQNLLYLSFADHESASHHVGKRVVETLDAFRHAVVDLGERVFRVQQDKSLKLVIVKALNFVLTHPNVQHLSNWPRKGRSNVHDTNDNWTAQFSDLYLLRSRAQSLWYNFTDKQNSNDTDCYRPELRNCLIEVDR